MTNDTFKFSLKIHFTSSKQSNLTLYCLRTSKTKGVPSFGPSLNVKYIVPFFKKNIKNENEK